MRVTVAEPQVRGREAQNDRSGRQIRDHRNTNWQRGRMRAASMRAKDEAQFSYQDASCRARWRAEKVHVLTRGELRSESGGAVSRGRSSDENCRKAEGVKGRRNHQQRSTEHCVNGQNTPRRQQTVAGSRDPLREPDLPMRCSRDKREGERNSH
jgi:hypothetical protein